MTSNTAPWALLCLTPTELTLGERMVVIRRRHGYTQRHVAEVLHLPRRALQEIEADTYAGEVTDRILRFTDIRGTLSDHEKCFIARRRAGKSVNDIARIVGVSRQWVSEMESGRESCEMLMRYWGF